MDKEPQRTFIIDCPWCKAKVAAIESGRAKKTGRTEEEQERFEKFLIYFFKGWLRPDLFPFSYEKKNQWFDFFNSISYGEFGERKITGAIFRNFHFYENYHIQNVKKIRHGGI